MTQDERWILKYNEVVSFIKTNHRNPSRHRLEDYDYLNCLKDNRKKMNAGELQGPRLSMFKELLEMVDVFKRVNQYV